MMKIPLPLLRRTLESSSRVVTRLAWLEKVFHPGKNLGLVLFENRPATSQVVEFFNRHPCFADYRAQCANRYIPRVPGYGYGDIFFSR
jgi:uncharacterized membrane protein YesL